MSARTLVVDAGPPSTFARTGRLDLFGNRCFGKTYMPAEVHAEIVRGIAIYPQLRAITEVKWITVMPPVCEIEGLRRLELTRMALAGSTQNPRKNLGEAAVIELARALNCDVVADDFDAAVLARQRGLRVLRSADLLAECVAMGDLTCQEAVALYESMREVTSLPVLTKKQLCS